MPFILKQYRGCLDWYISDAEDNKVWDCLLGLQKTLSDTNQIPKDKFFGALNYTICQLYRKSDVSNSESITLMLLQNFFMQPPRYDGLMYATGTLYKVRYVFREHVIDSGINSTDDIVSSIDRLIAYIKDRYIVHEHKVKQENGDLD